MDPQTRSWPPMPRPSDAFTASNRRGNQTLAAQQHRREPRRRSHRPSRSGVTWRTTSNPGSQPATVGASTTARSRNGHCRRRRGPRAGSAPARGRPSSEHPPTELAYRLRVAAQTFSDIGQASEPEPKQAVGNSAAPSRPEPRPSLGTQPNVAGSPRLCRCAVSRDVFATDGSRGDLRREDFQNRGSSTMIIANSDCLKDGTAG